LISPSGGGPSLRLSARTSSVTERCSPIGVCCVTVSTAHALELLGAPQGSSRFHVDLEGPPTRPLDRAYTAVCSLLPRKPRSCHVALGPRSPVAPVSVERAPALMGCLLSVQALRCPYMPTSTEGLLRASAVPTTGPSEGPEIPKFSYWRVRKSRSLYAAAAQLIAACLNSKIGSA
jgi:hypothetical protein